jgi:hypothetical protein
MLDSVQHQPTFPSCDQSDDENGAGVRCGGSVWGPAATLASGAVRCSAVLEGGTGGAGGQRTYSRGRAALRVAVTGGSVGPGWGAGQGMAAMA